MSSIAATTPLPTPPSPGPVVAPGGSSGSSGSGGSGGSGVLVAVIVSLVVLILLIVVAVLFIRFTFIYLHINEYIIGKCSSSWENDTIKQIS